MEANYKVLGGHHHHQAAQAALACMEKGILEMTYFEKVKNHPRNHFPPSALQCSERFQVDLIYFLLGYNFSMILPYVLIY